MSSMTISLAMAILAQTAPVKAVPATSSTKEMYAYWCTPERTKSVLCQHHELVGQMSTTPDADGKKKISEKIRELLKPATPAATTPGAPRPVSPFSKEYQSMKMAYCATNPPGGKTLCATAASQYKTAGSSSTRPSAASSPATLSSSEVWTWFCAKAGSKSAENENLCSNYEKRSGILAKLRTSGVAADERKKLTDELKLLPAVPYATTQGMYADFCKVAANAEKPTCTRLKMTQASVAMRSWYCAQPSNGESNWCKRSKLLEQLQKIPANPTDPSQAEQRKSLSAEYAAFSKPAAGGGPSLSSQIAKEIVTAKKSYCEVDTNKQIPYCKSPSGITPAIGSSTRKLAPLGR